jgi:secondary thiamine-phosphate synthase enzyme
MKSISIKTDARTEFIDITSKIEEIIRKNQWGNGILCVYVPHTTAGVTINECADPSVQKDILNQLNKMVPFEGSYLHTEGNSAAHIKASLIGSSINLIVENNKLALGRWQGIFFCEFDGPRSREAYLYFHKD